LGAFAAVGWCAYREVMAHAVIRYGGPMPEMRLAAEMAGLFAGGIAVAAVGIAMVWGKGRG